MKPLPKLTLGQTLPEQVAAVLRQAILQGQFEPGQRMVQNELSLQLGVSRMPVREALRLLEAEGLVSVEPRRGAVVTPPNRDDLAEVYLLRQLLEPLAARLGLAGLSAEDREVLAELVTEMEQAVTAGQTETFVRLNREFHELLYQASGQRRLLAFIRTLWNGLPPHTPTFLPQQVERSLAEHRAMLAAIAANDGDRLEQLMKEHIGRTGESLSTFVWREA